MSDYHLCDAGVTLRSQIDKRWPKRDKASDGWIGDASHQAAVSDHNPDYSAGGVVRAIDVDSNLGEKGAMDTLARQLAACGRDRRDNDRLSYIIWDHRIATNTYGWVWKPYSGVDPHTNHMHVSFTDRGDDRGGEFDLPVFTAPARHRLRNLITRLRKRITNARRRLNRMGD